MPLGSNYTFFSDCVLISSHFVWFLLPLSMILICALFCRAPTLGGMVPPSKSSFVLCCLRINVRDPIRYAPLVFCYYRNLALLSCTESTDIHPHKHHGAPGTWSGSEYLLLLNHCQLMSNVLWSALVLLYEKLYCF